MKSENLWSDSTGDMIDTIVRILRLQGISAEERGELEAALWRWSQIAANGMTVAHAFEVLKEAMEKALMKIAEEIKIWKRFGALAERCPNMTMGELEGEVLKDLEAIRFARTRPEITSETPVVSEALKSAADKVQRVEAKAEETLALAEQLSGERL